MANTSSSATAVGGLDSTGNSNDTILTLRGNQIKQILSIAWSYGANGITYPTPGTNYGRLIVLDGASVSSTVALNMGVGADQGANGLAQFGGKVKLDLDVCVSPASGVVGGQLQFSADSNEGALESTSGLMSVILTAPRSGGNVTNTGGLIGKLVVQFKTIATTGSNQKTYDYAPVSRPVI